MAPIDIKNTPITLETRLVSVWVELYSNNIYPIIRLGMNPIAM